MEQIVFKVKQMRDFETGGWIIGLLDMTHDELLDCWKCASLDDVSECQQEIIDMTSFDFLMRTVSWW